MAEWTEALLRVLADGPARYNRLLERLEGVPPRILTAALRSLEESGLVERRMEAYSVPYALTGLGQRRVGAAS